MTDGPFGYKYTYITEADIEEYKRFCLHHIRQHGHPLPDEIWHYTSAEALIEILKTGRMFSTQVTCMNDNLEQRYFGDLLHFAIKEQAGGNTDPHLRHLFQLADDAMEKRDFSTAWHFITCFSEAKDDLNQWRGYGGGECGYAIAFSSSGLCDVLRNRGSGRLLPTSYVNKSHVIVSDTLKMARHFFKAGILKGYTDVETWARDFFIAFTWELDIFASITKHPAFSGERESRILVHLREEEYPDLEFRQKKTLLARHLPLDLTLEKDEKKKLPITRVMIGPSPAKRISQVSVADLLKKYGYPDVPVEMTNVPYRVP